MKTIFAIFVGVVMLVPNVRANESLEPFAVVELFGSEGCSSCPPADDFLHEITLDSRKNSRQIFTLSFHVDYWNYLGWPDPFSQMEFSQRQRRYAEVLSSSVYTPQMIINGQYEFVGSDRRKYTQYLAQALEKSASHRIDLEFQNINTETFELVFHCDSVIPQTLINIALVERDVVSQVSRGENAGRTLKHDHVVRDFKVIPLSTQEGRVTFPKPANEVISKFSIIAFLQNEETLRITAAQTLDLKELMR